MTFSTLNGWQLLALNQSPSKGYTYHGEHSPGYSGRPFRRRRDIPRRWELETKFASQNYCDTLEGLLAGQGHVINFEDGTAWTSQGVTPESGSVYTINYGTAKFGYNSVTVADGDSLLWNPRLPPKWTIMYWYLDGTWEHRAIRSDGGKWSDGSRDDLLSFPEVVNGSGGIGFSPSGTNVTIDDVVILPFVAHFSLIEEHYDTNEAFSALPYLNLSGDIVGGETVQVLGKVNSQNHVQSTDIFGDRINNSRQLRIQLDEKKRTARKRLPAAAAWYFHDDYRDTATLSATNRLLPTATGVNLTYGLPGPFGKGQAAGFDGSGDWVELPQAVVQNMAGAKGYTVMSWLKVDSYASRNQIVRFMLDNSSNVKLEVNIETSGAIRVRVRSGPSAATLRTYTSPSVSTDTTRYHLWGASVDLVEAEAYIWLDGELVYRAPLSGATEQTTFTNDAGSTNRFGANETGGNELNGQASTCLLIDRVVEVGEVRAIFDAGREGVFV